VPLSLKIAFRRFQFRYLKRRPIWWTAFWVYLGILAVSSVFSDRGLFTAYRIWTQKERLERDISSVAADVGDLTNQVRDFRSDPRTLERYAREELQLVGKDEIQYIFQ
jgi:cell division protein FtsB